MTRRFILLDQSIEDSTGHYLEYAKRVLRAAKLEGFETVLAVNKQADDIVCQEADIIDKAFTHTFCENQVLSYKKLALGLLKKNNPLVANPEFSQHYAQELQAFFLRIKATNDDIVFVPTLGSTELMGITLYACAEGALALNWHLLFRHDLPAPTSLADIRAHLGLARVNTAFAEANKRVKKGTLSFYTDTEELTSRYSKLGFVSFTTLPIPIDETLGTKKKQQTRPLVITYLGDAREEKGFHLLPGLISSLRSAGFDEKRVRFCIQANLPRSGNTSRVLRAKEQLTDYPKTEVELLEGPFDSDAYNRLILLSEIILIPYCPKSYAVRSSGIFSEALAAGVPTLYPEDTWMANTQKECGSLGFKKFTDMSTVLIQMLSSYTEYETKSIAYSHEWRNKHSARKLVRTLAKAVQIQTYGLLEPLETLNGNL